MRYRIREVHALFGSTIRVSRPYRWLWLARLVAWLDDGEYHIVSVEKDDGSSGPVTRRIDVDKTVAKYEQLKQQTLELLKAGDDMVSVLASVASTEDEKEMARFTLSEICNSLNAKS